MPTSNWRWEILPANLPLAQSGVNCFITETADARAVVVGRRAVRAAATEAQGPRLELRLRHGPHRDGHAFRLLTLIDEHSRDGLALDVARRLSSEDVLERLSDLFVRRGVSTFLRSDNGSEFTTLSASRSRST